MNACSSPILSRTSPWRRRSSRRVLAHRPLQRWSSAPTRYWETVPSSSEEDPLLQGDLAMPMPGKRDPPKLMKDILLTLSRRTLVDQGRQGVETPPARPCRRSGA